MPADNILEDQYGVPGDIAQITFQTDPAAQACRISWSGALRAVLSADVQTGFSGMVRAPHPLAQPLAEYAPDKIR